MMIERTYTSNLFSRIKCKRRWMSAVRDYPVGCGPQPVWFELPKKAQNNTRTGSTSDEAASASVNIGPNSKKLKLMGSGTPFPTQVGLAETVDEYNRASCVDGCEEMEPIDLRLTNLGSKEMPSAKSNSSQASFAVRKRNYLKTSMGKNVNHPHRKYASGTRTFPRNARHLSGEKPVELGASRKRSLDAEHKESSPHTSQSHAPSWGSRVVSPREKVRETLRLFQAVFRQLSLEQHAKREDATDFTRRIDYKTWTVLKNRGKHVNRGKMIGNVPGIEIGDVFQYKAELSVVGLHRSMRGGIDYMRRGNEILTTSIVSSGSYNDEMEKDVVIYTGQGGNVERMNKKAEDQRLVTGNLALSNSWRYKTAVRVIRGEGGAGGRGKIYVYEGLYLVEEIWREMGPRGKLVFKFKLRRMSGQPLLR